MSTSTPSPTPSAAVVDLARFFAPRSAAIIGATEDFGKFGGKCTRYMIEMGYPGPFYPINPRRDEIFGRKAYPGIDALPEVPDHVGIVLPADAIPDAVAQCARLGVPFATVFSAGFGETGTPEGIALQQRTVALARAGGLRLMGPNCNGMVSFVNRFTMSSSMTIMDCRDPPGDIGVVSQSGGAGQVNILWRGFQAGLRFSHQVSSGNDADLTLLDYLAFMVEDPHTRVVLVLAERIADGDRLRAVAARAAELDKPIVMVKVGRTDVGARAAASHTGSITGADDVCDAALKQLGILRVDDASETIDAAMMLRRRQRPRGRGMAATSISGGNLVLLSDLGAAMGIEWPAYQASTQARLRELLPAFGAASNPTDLTAASIGNPKVFAEVSRTIAEDPAVHVFTPVITFSPAAEIRSLAQVAETSDKAIPILWTGKCLDDPGLTAAVLVAEGHAVYRDPLPCLKAVRTAMRYQEFQATRARGPVARPAGVDAGAIRAALAGRSGTLSEHASKALLCACGLPSPRESLATDEAMAVGLAREVRGPVALKLQSPDIPHKTEAGALRLGVEGDAAVARAYQEVLSAARRYRPDARVEGVLVQEMAGAGLDILIGVTRDITFGPVVTVGLGGIFVEVLKDVALALPPFDTTYATSLLRSLRSYPLLEGVRGQPALDVDALADCMARVSWLACDAPGSLRELDLNPVRVLPRGRGVLVLDALAVLG